MYDFNLSYDKYLSEFNEYLHAYTAKLKTFPTVLGESMQYSLLNGGKRVRPVLALACADVLGVDKQEILPFALAFAGGTMLYVISDEMIPETHAHGSQRGATYALLFGFCLMLVCDVLLG